MPWGSMTSAMKFAPCRSVKLQLPSGEANSEFEGLARQARWRSCWENLGGPVPELRNGPLPNPA